MTFIFRLWEISKGGIAIESVFDTFWDCVVLSLESFPKKMSLSARAISQYADRMFHRTSNITDQRIQEVRYIAKAILHASDMPPDHCLTRDPSSFPRTSVCYLLTLPFGRSLVLLPPFTSIIIQSHPMLPVR